MMQVRVTAAEMLPDLGDGNKDEARNQLVFWDARGYLICSAPFEFNPSCCRSFTLLSVFNAPPSCSILISYIRAVIMDCVLAKHLRIFMIGVISLT